VTALALIISALLAACASARTPPAGSHSPPDRTVPVSSVLTGIVTGGEVPARFVATTNWPAHPGVALYDSRTGAVIRRLLPPARDGMTVAGLSVDRWGNLWITYSRGPRLRAPGLLDQEPEPHTCRNEIVVWHARSATTSVYLRPSDNVIISGAMVSPDGQMLAFNESGCATGYMDSYIRVRDIASGRNWTIGQQLGRCNNVDPAWTADSKNFIVAYAAPPKKPYRGPQDTCSWPRREEVAEVSATLPQPGMAGRTAEAQAHCQITSTAQLAGGQVLAIEACGGAGQFYLSGPARLLVFNSQLRLVRQFSLGRCTDGNDLSTDVSGSAALITAYLFCNPPGHRQPVTRLWSYAGGVLRPIARVPQGTLAWAYMTW
jgi:hypothetical protein